jgi:hypothetical protein
MVGFIVKKNTLWPVAGVSRTTGSGGSPQNFSWVRLSLGLRELHCQGSHPQASTCHCFIEARLLKPKACQPIFFTRSTAFSNKPANRAVRARENW